MTVHETRRSLFFNEIGGQKNMAFKCELYNDSMQGWKCYPIQKAQLIIADVPYNVGTNFYGSNPMWYKGGGQ